MKLFTIGFTQKSAKTFFGKLKDAGVKRLLDVRLNNISQLAGFTKKNDLAFFAREICGIGYEHRLELAPTQDLLDAVKKKKTGWDAYEGAFEKLMASRKIEKLDRNAFAGACLLCSEAEPHHCHRRLVAEYLRDHWKGVEIEHL